MADITAAMVKEPARAFRRWHDGLQEGAGRNQWRHGSRRRSGCAPRALPPLPRSRAARRLKVWSALPFRGTKGTAVEVNSRNRFRRQERTVPGFREGVRRCARSGSNDVEAIKAAAYPGGGTVQEVLTNNIATIGENQNLRRAKKLSVSAGRGRALCPQCGSSRAWARSAFSSRSKAKPRRQARSIGQAAGHACRRGLPDGARRIGRVDVGNDRTRTRDRTRKRPPKAASLPTSSPRWSMAREAKFAKENALLNQLFVIDNKTKIADVVAAGKEAGADRAEGLCPLPAWRRHRKGSQRLRSRSGRCTSERNKGGLNPLRGIRLGDMALRSL
jgi:elongation factor Ts